MLLSAVTAGSGGLRVEEDGHRAVVAGVHLHVGAEFAVLHLEAPLPAMGHEFLIQRNGQVRFGGLGEARAAGGSNAV